MKSLPKDRTAHPHTCWGVCHTVVLEAKLLGSQIQNRATTTKLFLVIMHNL